MKTYSFKWLSVGVLMLVVIVYWLSRQLSFDDANYAVKHDLPSSSASTDSHAQVTMKTPNISAGQEEIPVLKKRTATEKAVIDDWFSRSGYKSSDRESYLHYTDEQLVLMSDQGDVDAMLTLMNRYIDQYQSKNAIPFAQKAIVYGSLSAIRAMSNLTDPYSMGSSMEEIKKEMIESFAYNHLLALRGDELNSERRVRLQIDAFKRKNNTDIVFTFEEERQIEKRAQELYAYYQSERYKLGLGDFDNETPQEVKDFFELD